ISEPRGSLMSDNMCYADDTNERILERLAHAEDWRIDNLSRLVSSVASLQDRIQAVTDSLPNHWKGTSAEIAVERLRVMKGNFGKLRAAMNNTNATITGVDETRCLADCSNTIR